MQYNIIISYFECCIVNGRTQSKGFDLKRFLCSNYNSSTTLDRVYTLHADGGVSYMYIRTAAVGNTKVGVDDCTSFLAVVAGGNEGHRQIARRRVRVIVNQLWMRPSPFVIFSAGRVSAAHYK